jgi:hypothetical protein
MALTTAANDDLLAMMDITARLPTMSAVLAARNVKVGVMLSFLTAKGKFSGVIGDSSTSR